MEELRSAEVRASETRRLREELASTAAALAAARSDGARAAAELTDARTTAATMEGRARTAVEARSRAQAGMVAISEKAYRESHAAADNVAQASFWIASEARDEYSKWVHSMEQALVLGAIGLYASAALAHADMAALLLATHAEAAAASSAHLAAVRAAIFNTSGAPGAGPAAAAAAAEAAGGAGARTSAFDVSVVSRFGSEMLQATDCAAIVSRAAAGVRASGAPATVLSHAAFGDLLVQFARVCCWMVLSGTRSLALDMAAVAAATQPSSAAAHKCLDETVPEGDPVMVFTPPMYVLSGGVRSLDNVVRGLALAPPPAA
jgi:hypothetical protein